MKDPTRVGVWVGGMYCAHGPHRMACKHVIDRDLAPLRETQTDMFCLDQNSSLLDFKRNYARPIADFVLVMSSGSSGGPKAWCQLLLRQILEREENKLKLVEAKKQTCHSVGHGLAASQPQNLTGVLPWNKVFPFLEGWSGWLKDSTLGGFCLETGVFAAATWMALTKPSAPSSSS